MNYINIWYVYYMGASNILYKTTESVTKHLNTELN